MNLTATGFTLVAFFVLIALPINRHQLLVISVFLFSFGTLSRSLAVQFPILAMLATGLESVATASLLCGTMKSLSSRQKAFDPSSKSFLLVGSLTACLLLAHNLSRFSEISAPANAALVSAINPWGLFSLISTFFLFLYSTAHATNPWSLRLFEKSITVSSITFIGIDALVYVGILAGNTSKLMDGVGGICPANFSTNDAATFALSLLIWHLHFFISEKRSFGVHGSIALALLVAIALTKSRSGAGAAGVVLAIFFFRSQQYSLGIKKKTILRRAIVGLVLGSSILAGLQIIQQRNSAEYSLQNEYSDLSSSSGVSGSGRSLIWFEFGSSFLAEYDKNEVVALIGVGQFGLSDLYNETILSRIGFSAGSVKFLPVHSDALALLFCAGLMGAIFMLRGLIWTFKNRQFLKTSPLSLSALVILFIASTVDNLQMKQGTYALLFSAFFYGASKVWFSNNPLQRKEQPQPKSA